jgi:CRISPR type I-E-associated protein CasA/Cse1
MGERFDLLTEPWIVCTRKDGPTRLGITAVLCSAHEIIEVADPSPLATFAIYRLLLATLRWVMPLPDLTAWRKAWTAGRFPKALVSDLGRRGSGHFDLFDAAHPFYQDPSAAPANSPVSELAPDLPGATNIVHFRHSRDSRAALCAACAARGLAMLPAFCTSGGSGKQPSINEAPPVYFMPRGGNLFQTLLLNQPVPGVLSDWPSAAPRRDVPAWEGTTSGTGPVGFMEGLTWQPRRVLLRPAADAGARCSLCGDPAAVQGEIAFLKGRPPPRDRRWDDPHVLLGPERKGKKTPLRPGKEPAAGHWRFAAQALIAEEPPLAVRQLRELVRGGKLGSGAPRLALQSFVFHTFQMRFSHAASSMWTIPPAVLTDPTVAAALRAELDFAEGVVKEIAKARLWAEAATHVAWDEGWARCQSAIQPFETEAERAFRRLVAEVSSSPAEMVPRIDAWCQALRAAADRVFAPARDAMRPLATIDAERRFRSRLDRVFAQGGRP